MIRLSAAVLAGTLLTGHGARADEPKLQGVFVNAAQSDAVIDAAIEATVSHASLAARPFVRRRLKTFNATLRRVEIARRGAEFAITLGASTPSVTSPGRPPVKWTREDGEVFDVVLAWRAAALLQTVTQGESRRVNRFELSPDGMHLTLQVVLTGPQLQVPVQYQLTFQRLQ